jgi:hypothetical protein
MVVIYNPATPVQPDQVAGEATNLPIRMIIVPRCRATSDPAKAALDAAHRVAFAILRRRLTS